MSTYFAWKPMALNRAKIGITSNHTLDAGGVAADAAWESRAIPSNCSQQCAESSEVRSYHSTVK